MADQTTSPSTAIVALAPPPPPPPTPSSVTSATASAAAIAGTTPENLNWGEIDTASFQSILNWSLRQTGDGTVATASELMSAADPERREWLRKAFDALTVDMVKVLKENIEKLHLKDDDEDVVEKKLDALQALEDLVEDLDNARDLHLLGGFAPVLQCLRSKHVEIRSRSLDLVGTVVQNNPICQQFALELKAMAVTLPMLNDESDQVRIKAVRACSCLVRDHQVLLQQFLDGDGVGRLASFLSSSNEQLLNRTLFFLAHLSRDGSATTAYLEKSNVVEKIFQALQSTNSNDIWEHGLSALLNLASNQPFAPAAIKALPLSAALSKRADVRKAAPQDEQDRFREEIEFQAELQKLL